MKGKCRARQRKQGAIERSSGSCSDAMRRSAGRGREGVEGKRKERIKAAVVAAVVLSVVVILVVAAVAAIVDTAVDEVK